MCQEKDPRRGQRGRKPDKRWDVTTLVGVAAAKSTSIVTCAKRPKHNRANSPPPGRLKYPGESDDGDSRACGDGADEYIGTSGR